LISNNKIKEIKQKIPDKIFRFGIFLLPTALSLSIIFVLISIIIGLKKTSLSYLKDNYNRVFFLCSIFMMLSSFYNFIFADYSQIGIVNNYFFLIGLFNWIPFFILFWGVQMFLDSPEKRKIVAKYLIAGTIPVILLAIFQKWFSFTGPFNFLNGLIIWYQYPITKSQAVTSIFNNPNYLGTWLSTILPFCIVLIINNKKIGKFIFSLIILISTTTIILLTNSRNAILGIFFASQLFFIAQKKYLFFYISLVLILVAILNNYDNLPDYIKTYLQIIPERYLREISQRGFQDLDITRTNIWITTIEFIKSKPITGWGAGSFSYVFKNATTFYKGHPHNLPLHIAFSYGIMPAIIISTVITNLLIKSLLKILRDAKCKFNQEYLIFDQGWITASIIIYFSHLFDITYFDGRISILGWILMAGLRTIIREKFLSLELS